jgi:hypothetical protein
MGKTKFSSSQRNLCPSKLHCIEGEGIIARDHNGCVSTALCKQVSLMPEPTTREAMGALLAAKFRRDMGLQDILLEGDSMNTAMRYEGENKLESLWACCGRYHNRA